MSTQCPHCKKETDFKPIRIKEKGYSEVHLLKTCNQCKYEEVLTYPDLKGSPARLHEAEQLALQIIYSDQRNKK